MRDEMPQEIQSLIAQCEVGVSSFTNDQMSAALRWGETLHKAMKAAHEYIVCLRQMNYAGDPSVYEAAWRRADAVGSRYYAARSAAGVIDE